MYLILKENEVYQLNMQDNIVWKFKTHEEFCKEFGEDFGLNYKDFSCNVDWTIGMNYLLGTVIPEKLQIKCFQVYFGLEKELFQIDNWWISKEMITYDKV